MRRTHHIEIRLLLTCFYIYLNCSTFLYIKQMLFHYSLLSLPFTYIHIRAIVGGCVLIIYRFLLLYALWRKIPDLLLISILFLTALITVRIIFDTYGYFSGYINQSLYYPFYSFERKSMLEEIIDLIFTLVQDSTGLLMSFYMLKDIFNKNTRSRQSVVDRQRGSSVLE